MVAKSSPKGWRTYWEQIVRPGIQPEDHLYQVTPLLAALVLVALIVTPIWVLTNPNFKAAAPISVAIIVTLLIAWVLSRRGHYRAGASLLILLMLLTVAVVIVAAPGPITARMLALNLFVVAILLASILLSIRVTLLVAWVCVVATAGFLFVPDVPFYVAYSYLVYIVVMSALFIVSTIVRTQYAQGLSESRSRYRSLFDQSTDAVLILDLNDDAIDANRRATEMLGYSLDALRGLSAAALFGESDLLAKVRRGEVVAPYKHVLHKKNGELIPVELSVELARDARGSPQYIQMVARDISQRQELQEARKIARLGAWDLDWATGGLIWAEEHYELLGIPAGTPMTLTSYNRMLHPDDLEPTLREFHDLLHRQVADYTQDYRIIRLDGQIRHLTAHARVTYQPDGTPLRITGVTQDITERKSAEALNQAFLRDMKALQEIHLELSEIEEIDTLYQRMVELAQKRLGIDRIGLFLVDHEANLIVGTYGIDTTGSIRDERDYSELISSDHWSLEILNSPNHLKFWGDSPLMDSGVQVGIGWKVGTALWDGHQTLGYMVADSFISRKPARPYEAELISVLGSTYGHLIRSKQVVEHLRESEERYRSVVTAMSEGIILQGRDGTIHTCNAAAEELLGLTVDQMKRYLSLDPRLQAVQPDLSPFTGGSHPAMVTLHTGEPLTNIVMGVHKPDGELRWISINSQPLYHPNGAEPYAVVASFTDITERKRVEDSLRTNEMRQRALLKAMPDLMFRSRRDGTFLDYQAADLTDLAVPPEQFLGRTIGEVLPADLADLHMRQIERVFQTGKETVYEYSMVHSEQTAFFEARMVICAPDEVLTIVRNITERKLSETQVFALALEKEQVKVLSQFVQTASHELRTPLAAMKTSLYLMTRLTDEEKRLEHLQRIDQNVNRLAHLLDMVLSMTRLDSDVPFKFQPVDVNHLIEEEIDAVQPVSQEQAVSVQFSPDHALPLPNADIDWLQQALKHLLDNAIRFTANRGSVTVRTYSQAERIVIEIRDTGVGIDEEALAHIFERFWRQDKAHSTPGFGLGLPIAQKIIERHGGTIEVESELDIGSVFRVLLPVTQAG